MPFIYKDNGNSNGSRILMRGTLVDSKAFTVGDAVKWVSGEFDLWGAGGAGVGILHSFANADGTPVTDNGGGGDYEGTYTTGASNTVVAIVDISTSSRYSVTADATLGTTTGSDLAGTNADCLAASDQLDESTFVAAGSTASFYSHGVDPDPEAPANSVIVSIQESMVKL